MTLQFPVDPAIGFSEFKMSLQRKTTILRSPFTGARQAQLFSSALWHVEVTVVPLDQIFDPVPLGKLISFLVQLQGQNQPFTLFLPGINAPAKGYAGNIGKVNGAGQTGTTLITNGWNASTTILNQGDKIYVAGETKIITSDIASDSNGNATLTFEPMLRTSPPNGILVFISNISLTLAADADDVAGWDITIPSLHSISFNATETF